MIYNEYATFPNHSFLVSLLLWPTSTIYEHTWNIVSGFRSLSRFHCTNGSCKEKTNGVSTITGKLSKRNGSYEDLRIIIILLHLPFVLVRDRVVYYCEADKNLWNRCTFAWLLFEDLCCGVFLLRKKKSSVSNTYEICQTYIARRKWFISDTHALYL